METVTLGVVGDTRVGKTLLLVSFVENYVFKEYKPTVLNCFWTNLTVDNIVIDLRIWDNTGKTEYADLRPLSYPQTDCFLLCFSLRSRPSFINVRIRWLKEIKQHKDDVPVILVGCKNDNLLQEDDGKGKDLISKAEAESLAKVIGAVAYVETSAIEQTGLNECFTKAIGAALIYQKRNER